MARLFYLDLPPQQILKDTAGEQGAGSTSFFFSATISFSTSRRQRNAFALKPLQKINKPRRSESTNGLKKQTKKNQT